MTKMSLPRRTFLRGMGAVVALPLLDAMVPASTMLAQTPARPVRRFGAIMVPQGAVMDQWTPTTAGADFEFSPILKPIERFRDHVVVVSGTGNTTADGGHAPGPNCFLSGLPGKKTETADIELGITIDQVIARQVGQTTTFPSLEVATEDFTGFVGACDNGWACAYLNTITWASATQPLPMEINPRIVFERMFGGTGTPEERVARMQLGRSILDSIIPEATRLQSGLGSRDRAKLDAYLENIREIERRLERAEQNSDAQVTLDAPVGVPADFEEHAGLMFDLLHVAFQADVTRVFSFMMARELSQRTYPHINCLDPHHAMSHHRNEPLLLAANQRLQTYHYGLFGQFLDKLKNTPDGDGSLLDHSLIMYGSGMADSNAHSHQALPIVVVGGAGGRVKGNRHLAYPKLTPIANLHVAFAQKLDVPLEKFGDSNGVVDL
ncbi:MAG: DUF1552 domain-containing protein [Acidobacteria bacterium]|nr:DUF1552 domain-containing protein [Acidobacteriota bacterium]